MTDATFEITKATTFDAAHYLQAGAADNPYRRLHGHSFRVEASVRGPADATGWVADLGDLGAALRAVAGELDHGLLNEKEGLQRPTLESLCVYFAERLKPRFPGLSRVLVERPTLHESCTLSL
jgi:6-pyruvoyltetrahydropterin/6-carboxytetrahydropterin synthase